MLFSIFDVSTVANPVIYNPQRKSSIWLIMMETLEEANGDGVGWGKSIMSRRCLRADVVPFLFRLHLTVLRTSPYECTRATPLLISYPPALLPAAIYADANAGTTLWRPKKRDSTVRTSMQHDSFASDTSLDRTALQTTARAEQIGVCVGIHDDYHPDVDACLTSVLLDPRLERQFRAVDFNFMDCIARPDVSFLRTYMAVANQTAPW
ncbi:hypothetical protein B0H13DRAFT_2394334 [Mycena leptocephala]|nr:hypothetical protein B0H13DRAFT_2394334 [Mycena leptocephala]